MNYCKHLLLLNLVALAVLAQSCRHNRPASVKKHISVSILPLKYFVDKIAGEEFTVSVLLPPGSNPATYEPTMRQVIGLSNSRVYFGISSLGFERAWKSNIEKAVGRYVDVSKGIDLIEARHQHGDHLHLDADPHIWLSCKNAQIISKSIHTVLLDLWPRHDTVFNRNLDILLQQIQETDSIIEMQLAHNTNRQFMIYHPSLSYFARDYELKQLPIEWDGKEPSPAYLKSLIDLAAKESINTILVQKEFPSQKVSALANTINARLITIDPLAYQWNKNMLSICSNLANSD